VLQVVQGHPKLMELADAAAADRDRLDAQLDAAEQAAAGSGRLEAFFRDGTTTLDPAQFLDALTRWTVTALGELIPAARLMAEFVACLEDSDRLSPVIEANWVGLWRRLSRSGEPSEPGPLLTALATAALVEPDPVLAADTGDQRIAGRQSDRVAYRMHPGVAAAIAAAAELEIREAVDAELGAFWNSVAYQASEREHGEDSALIVQAGLAAAPYLLRRSDWRTASTLLEYVVRRDESPETVQAVLPGLRQIAAATGRPDDVGVLARALSPVDPGEAERLMRAAIEAADVGGDYRLASTCARDLVRLLGNAGRLSEALAATGQAADYTRRAGLGLWTQLADQTQRLQLLGLMGEHARVLAEVDRLRATMAALPRRRDPDEIVNPWSVREFILSIGRSSALAMGEWGQSLELNAETTASMRARDAGLHEVTRIRFNDAAPLIELGRLNEAARLLAECQRVFEELADAARLGTVLSIRATLEDRLGHPTAAADLGRAALRLSYTRPEPRGIAVEHHNLANYLRRLGNDRAEQRAHRLAAALIRRLAGMAHELDTTVRALAVEVRADGREGVGLPATVTQVVSIAEQAEGVRLGDLLAALQPDPRAADSALAEILRAASGLDSEDLDVQYYLRQWEPVIAAIVTVYQGEQNTPAELLEFIEDRSRDPDWTALTASLRRILAGERNRSLLLNNLDPIDHAIVTELLSRTQEPPEDELTYS